MENKENKLLIILSIIFNIYVWYLVFLHDMDRNIFKIRINIDDSLYTEILKIIINDVNDLGIIKYIFLIPIVYSFYRILKDRRKIFNFYKNIIKNI